MWFSLEIWFSRNTTWTKFLTLMTDKLYIARVGDRIVFPTWRSLFHSLYHSEEGRFLNVPDCKSVINSVLEKVEAVRLTETTFVPGLSMRFVLEGAAEYQPGVPIQQVNSFLNGFNFGSNEFHTIYDIPTSTYSFISPKLEDILGISQRDFTLPNLYGNLPGGMHHPSDVFHAVRWGNLAYVVFGIPGFKFRANEDHYLIKHRIRVSDSCIKPLAHSEFVMIEKRCYLCNDIISGDKLRPSMHLDRWTVLDNERNHFVRPQFVTTPDQSAVMNAVLYLLNALLLNVPTKFILFMNERMDTDRNKAVAVRVSEKMERYARVKPDIDDQKVADCFAKTIRAKMSDLIHIWEPTAEGHSVKTDAEAVRTAQKLGLLPIPLLVERLLYQGISEL